MMVWQRYDAEVCNHLSFLAMQSPVAAGPNEVSTDTSGVLDHCRALVPVGQTMMVAAELGGVMSAAAPAPQALVGVAGKLVQPQAQGLAWPWGPWCQSVVPAFPPAAHTHMGGGYDSVITAPLGRSPQGPYGGWGLASSVGQAQPSQAVQSAQLQYVGWGQAPAESQPLYVTQTFTPPPAQLIPTGMGSGQTQQWLVSGVGYWQQSVATTLVTQVPKGARLPWGVSCAPPAQEIQCDLCFPNSLWGHCFALRGAFTTEH